jgi:hypothetical protein
VYLSGGLMAMAHDRGQRVVCVTATLGEHGTPDPQRWPPGRLARTRAAELRASLAVLGVTEHHLLGLPDGRCADQPFDTVVDQLVTIIDDVRPDTILTFGPDGFTGHSDHQTISAWAAAARARAATGARLLYASTTAEFIDRWQHVYDRLDVFLTEGCRFASRRPPLLCTCSSTTSYPTASSSPCEPRPRRRRQSWQPSVRTRCGTGARSNRFSTQTSSPTAISSPGARGRCGDGPCVALHERRAVVEAGTDHRPDVPEDRTVSRASSFNFEPRSEG